MWKFLIKVIQRIVHFQFFQHGLTGIFSDTVCVLIVLVEPDLVFEGKNELPVVVHRKRQIAQVLKIETMDRSEDMQAIQSSPG